MYLHVTVRHSVDGTRQVTELEEGALEAIACPFCGQRLAYPAGTLNEWRPCNCGAEWLVTPELGDELPEPDEGFEVKIVESVGTFGDRDTPGFTEPTHAIFRRAT